MTKPTALKKLEGTYRPDRANTKEAKPDVKRLGVPSWISDAAKQEWYDLEPELTKVGLITVIDKNLLAQYCELIAEMKELTQAIHKEGWTTTDKRGAVGRNPKVMARQAILTQISTLEKSLGLSPAARTKIKVDKPEKVKDELEDFLSD